MLRGNARDNFSHSVMKRKQQRRCRRNSNAGSTARASSRILRGISALGEGGVDMPKGETSEYDKKMRSRLALSTEDILSLPATDKEEFLNWLETTHVAGAKELRAAILERIDLLQETEDLQQQLYESRKKRASQFVRVWPIFFSWR